MCNCCEQLKEAVAARDRKIDALDQELRLALQMIEMMRRRMFGHSSEQTIPGQGQFDGLLAECDSLNGDAAAIVPEKEKLEFERRKNTPDNRNGRVKIPDHLERVDKLLDLPEAEKICPATGLPLIRIGEEITEQLAYEPGRLYAIRYIRPKYVSPDRRSGAGLGVKTAPLPDCPIDRCKADVSLLAHLIISKYCDHLPLHRQEQIFRRHGIELPKSSMCDWVGGSARALDPLYRLQRETVLKNDYLNADDTPILFKKANGQGAKKGHMWAYLCRVKRPPDRPPTEIEKRAVFFEFTDDWSEKHPQDTLKHFQGFLQSDAYAGFLKAAARPGVTGLGCWSHVRRKFFEAAQVGVKDAEHFVTLINLLYRIEHRIDALKAQGRPESYCLELRKKRASRVMNRFFAKARSTFLLPKSPLGKALTYALNQERALRGYIEQLRFAPDNNAAENILRPLCLGKKNYMLFGSECGGKNAAILYTLIGSCRANDINPYEYLKDVLARISSHPHAKLHELLPHNWQAQTNR